MDSFVRGENMIVENLNGLIRLIAEGDNKITNKNRSFYTDFIYLGKNDSVDNYTEVTSDVWKHFVEGEIPDEEINKLQKQISNLQEDKENLEFVLLNTDFRLTCMELKDEGILE